MNDILTETFPDEDDRPLPDITNGDEDVIREAISRMNEQNVIQISGNPKAIDALIKHLRLMRAANEDKPTRSTQTEEKTIDITKLVLKGKPLIAPPQKIRRL